MIKLKRKKIDEGRNKKDRGLELTPYLKKKTERATIYFCLKYEALRVILLK
jgi:hypothetical protein